MILVGQSIYNLSNLNEVDESIVTVHGTVAKLEQLANEVAKPMADVRILSMQLALAPNDQFIKDYSEMIDRELVKIEHRLTNLKIVWSRDPSRITLQKRYWLWRING